MVAPGVDFTSENGNLLRCLNPDFDLIRIYLRDLDMELTQQLLDELKTWCDAERGRRIEVAKLCGVSPQSVTNWFSGVQQPTAEQALTLLRF